jgi:superfamily II DNA or RNA helicase
MPIGFPNGASQMRHEKALERKHAEIYEHDVIRQHSLLPNTISWHWSVVPEDLLYEAGYIHDYNKHRLERLAMAKEQKDGENRVRDYGFDGLAKTTSTDGDAAVYHGIQAKNYHSRHVTAGDIGSFLLMMMRLWDTNRKAVGYLYTPKPLETNLASNLATSIVHVLHPYRPYEESTHGQDAELQTSRNHHPVECELPLRDYQIDALNQLAGHDGIHALKIPCRMGKTLIAGNRIQYVQSKQRLIVVLAPLKVSVENLRLRLPCFLQTVDTLLVDTDGTTDRTEIHAFLTTDSPRTRVVYSTFKSAVRILAELITDYTDCFILVDEVHNASQDVCDFINRFPNGLVMSATIPYEVSEMLNLNQVVCIPYSKGIRDGYIVDFTVWLPHLLRATDGTTSAVDVTIPVEFSEYDADLTAKAVFHATCMLKTGSRRCIVYLKSKSECAEYVEIVRKVLVEYHGLNTWVEVIDCDVQTAERKRILKAFEHGPDECFYVLASVRILDEAVDIPRCDSVFITTVGEHSSDIRMMQRSQRSSTKDPTNHSKHNNIFLWTDALEKCLRSFELLKMSDPDFHKKVRIAGANYDANGQPRLIEVIEAERREFVTWSEMKCLTVFDKHMLTIGKLCAFYDEHKEAPKQRGKRPNESTLATWMGNRRKDNKNGTLDSDLKGQIEHLLPLWSWDPFADLCTKAILEMVAFYEEYQEAPKAEGTRPGERELATWTGNRRQDNKNGTLSQEIKEQIERQLSWWSWGPYLDSHTKAILDLCAFHYKHKEPPKNRGTRRDERRLSSWIQNRRQDNKNGTLSSELKEQIECKLPWWSWAPIADLHTKAILDLVAFYEEHQEVPNKRGKRIGERALGEWVIDRRRDNNSGNLSSDVKDQIERQLRWWSWDPIADSHTKAILDLVAFHDAHREAPKHEGTRPGEKELATWTSNRRKDNKNETLSSVLKEQIECQLPWWSWEPFADKYAKTILELVAFYDAHQEAPKGGGTRPWEKELATWTGHRRKDNKNGTLDSDLKGQIECQLPWWSWNPIADSHTKAILDLVAFHDEHREAPKHEGTRPGEKELATWTSNRRNNKKKGTLSSDLKEQIERKLPWWSWTAVVVKWGRVPSG